MKAVDSDEKKAEHLVASMVYLKADYLVAC